MRRAVWLVVIVVVLPNVLLHALGLVVFTSRAWVDLDYFLVAAAAAIIGIGSLRLLLPVALLLDVVFSVAPAWHFTAESALRGLADIFHLPPAYWLPIALGTVLTALLVSEFAVRILRVPSAPPLQAESGWRRPFCFLAGACWSPTRSRHPRRRWGGCCSIT